MFTGWIPLLLGVVCWGPEGLLARAAVGKTVADSIGTQGDIVRWTESLAEWLTGKE